MSKRLILVGLVSLFVTHAALANHTATTQGSACESIAKACTKAGFARVGNHEMKFWQDCMKPVILGKSVKKVSIDAATVKTCRENKIVELKNELNEFQNVGN